MSGIGARNNRTVSRETCFALSTRNTERKKLEMYLVGFKYVEKITNMFHGGIQGDFNTDEGYGYDLDFPNISAAYCALQAFLEYDQFDREMGKQEYRGYIRTPNERMSLTDSVTVTIILV